MPDSPLERYRRDLQHCGFQHDDVQQRAVEHLDGLYRALCERRSQRATLWQRLARALRGRDGEPVTGIYLWGGVGRGKTYLMDTFYEALPFEAKLRTHFHRFMRGVHRELTRLKGTKNPLEKVADRLAAQAEVICFDEFFVADITDAMILGNLLRALFSRGVVLVATSNIPPHELYKNGLQRERFLPAIDLLERHTSVVPVDGDEDYRLRYLTKSPLFYYPLDEAAERALAGLFDDLVADREGVQIDTALEVEGRHIAVRRVADDVVWFDFAQLCLGPRSQNDYVVIAKEYHALILSAVPTLGAHNDDATRRFIYLVDELYDRRVKLALSSANPVSELYLGGPLAFEFQRTQSRLFEMQSKDYLALGHRP